MAILIVASASTAQAAEAQAKGRWSLTPTLGFSLPARLGSLVPLPQTADVPGIEVLLEPTEPEIGLTLGYRFGPRFDLQVGASRSGAGIYNDVGIGFAGIPLGKFLIAHTDVWTAEARLIYGFCGGIVEPYLAAGFGVTAMNAGNLGSKARPSLEVGAGIKARLADSLKMVFEVQDTVTFIRYFEDFRILYALVYSAQSQSAQHRIGARLGLEYVF
jgi:opacity protein-like surface antigen